MADSDDDSIFVDVKPRLDERSADEAVGKLRDKMSQAGDSLKDSLSGAFDHLSDKFGPLGKVGDGLHDMLAGAFSGKEWDNLGKQAGSALGQGISDSLKDVTHGDFGNILGEFGKVGDVLGGALDKLNGRLDTLSKAGGAVGNVLSGNASGNDLSNIITGAKGLGLKVPGAIDNAQHAFNLISFLNDHPGQIEASLSRNLPGIGTAENIISNGPRKVGEWIHDQFVGPQEKPSHGDATAWSQMALGHSPYASSSAANSVAVQTSSATVSAGTVTLAGGINLSSLGVGAPQSAASAGHGGSSHGWFTSAKGNPSMDALQSLLSPSQHHDTGGILPGDSPGFDNRIGLLPGGGMVGLEGGEGVINPRAMGRPGIADLVTQLNTGYDGGTMGPAGVGGDSNNPTLSTTPTTPNTAGGGNSPITQQQLGTGQGGGISGGGIIGAAEQAGVMAAAVGGFGGGGIAAQMAVQETNLAVQKTSQSIAALATAPFETFGLSGGMMGAPQVNPMGGWIGKLIAGELGSQTSLPNLAGASTQPPKQPDQKQPGDQQGQGETPSGPSGTKDDPHYVKSADGTPTPPQGSATSGMNMMPMTADF